MSLIALFMTVVVCFTTASSQTARSVFTPGAEEFTVSAPCGFSELKNSEEWKIYKCSLKGNWFFVTSNVDEASSQIAAIKLEASSRIVSNSDPVSKFSPALSAKHYTFSDHDGLYQNLITLQTPKLFYIFHTISENLDDPTVTEFLKSITIDRIPSLVRPISQRPKSILDLLKRDHRGNGKISRENAHLYKKSSDGQQLKQNATQSAAFRLLKQESPAFTPLALLYEIEGEVLVGVTFKASGDIGDIRPVKRLPLGLTANALAASRFLIFEPKVEAGEAISITKTVSFNYSIF